MRTSGLCVFVRGRGKKRQRKSAVGSRVKDGADPARAPGSQWQSGGREGSALGGGPRFNRDVKHDKDEADSAAEWSIG